MNYPANSDNKRLTLLAPARNASVARAAIQAGADAIYIGAPRFGARQAAGNSLDDIRQLVAYARTYGVDILVTLNTLLTDEERPEAVRMAWQLYEAGVSALIIQDLTLLDCEMPPIRLHASTQCDNRTPEQAVRLQRMGFRRVVLARELGLSEIRAIRDAVQQDALERGVEPIELEAFVHGALCVSYSGRCYLSECLTGRSANRGCCAQMCRLPYDILDRDKAVLRDDCGRPLAQQYALSLQDLDRSAFLAELIDAGVTTFKIEGRLKDEAYVTNITAYYRQKIDSLSAQQPDGDSVFRRNFEPNPAKTFHRGQTDYFLHGRTAHMANWQTPKSTGEAIGTVLAARGNTLTVRLHEGVVLHNGDGLSIAHEGFSVNGIQGNTLLINKPLSREPKTENREPGSLYRNLDTEFLRSLHAERRILLDLLVSETPDGFTITYSNATQHFSRHFVYPHEAASNPERALTTMREQLAKLGDTPYEVRRVTLQTQPYFIPISVLNSWRRELIPALPVPQQTKEETATNTASVGASFRTYSADIPEALMTCRYCMLYEMGHCRKLNPLANEPAYLRTSTGTLLRLTFDCRTCEMRISR